MTSSCKWPIGYYEKYYQKQLQGNSIQQGRTSPPRNLKLANKNCCAAYPRSQGAGKRESEEGEWSGMW